MHYFCKKFFWLTILANIVYFPFNQLCMHLCTSTHQFRLFCACMLLVPYFLLNSIRSGLAFKAAPLKFCHHAFNSGATLLCVGDFSHKIVFTVLRKKILIVGQGLAVKGGIKI